MSFILYFFSPAGTVGAIVPGSKFYVAEDGVTLYVAEDGVTNYIQES